MEIRHCDWLSTKVGQGPRRGRLVDIVSYSSQIPFEETMEKLYFSQIGPPFLNAFVI